MQRKHSFFFLDRLETSTPLVHFFETCQVTLIIRPTCFKTLTLSCTSRKDDFCILRK